jgi:tetratricopeptide (TPR) repeat protein
LAHTGFSCHYGTGVKISFGGGILSANKSARANIKEETNDIVSSMSYFVRHHKDSEQLFIQMRALFASGQLLEVNTLAQCVVNEYNDNIQNADFFILAAKAEIELHGFTKNVDGYLRQALKLAPFNDVALAFFKMSSACLDLKDGLYEKGEATLRRCLKTSSIRAYASFFLGHHLFWKNGELAEAVELLEDATNLRDSFLKAWVDLGLAYKRSGQREKANSAFEKCLKLDRETVRRAFYERHIERQ